MVSQGSNWIEHIGDKKPLGLLLSFLSVFAFSAWAYLDNQANLFAEAWQAEREWMIVAVENVSISKHVENGVLHVVCTRDPKCVPAYDDQTDMETIGHFVLEPNFSTSDKQVCPSPGGFFRFTFTLQPGERTMVRVKGLAANVSLEYFGRTPGPCVMASSSRDVYFLESSSMYGSFKASMLRYSREIAIAIAATALVALLWLVAVPMLRRKPHAVRRRRR